MMDEQTKKYLMYGLIAVVLIALIVYIAKKGKNNQLPGTPCSGTGTEAFIVGYGDSASRTDALFKTANDAKKFADANSGWTLATNAQMAQACKDGNAWMSSSGYFTAESVASGKIYMINNDSCTAITAHDPQEVNGAVICGKKPAYSASNNVKYAIPCFDGTSWSKYDVHKSNPANATCQVTCGGGTCIPKS